MFVKIENDKIVAFCETQFDETYIEVDKKVVSDFNGTLVFEEETQTQDYANRKREFGNEQLLNELRAKREVECFPIINRGELWYAALTKEQHNELALWYNDWLNITETKVIPVKPSWIKE